jgi:hypothetical protein
VLSLLLYPPGGGHPTEPEAPEGAGMSGQTTWRLLALGEVVAPFVPARVRVETVSAAAGATLEGMDVAGVAIAAVERGALAAAVERGFAQATSARVLATGAYGPGAASVGPGQRRLVREGGSLFVHPGSAVALAADPDGPLALLVVRLEPGSPAATPVP